MSCTWYWDRDGCVWTEEMDFPPSALQYVLGFWRPRRPSQDVDVVSRKRIRALCSVTSCRSLFSSFYVYSHENNKGAQVRTTDAQFSFFLFKPQTTIPPPNSSVLGNIIVQVFCFHSMCERQRRRRRRPLSALFFPLLFRCPWPHLNFPHHIVILFFSSASTQKGRLAF